MDKETLDPTAAPDPAKIENSNDAEIEIFDNLAPLSEVPSPRGTESFDSSLNMEDEIEAKGSESDEEDDQEFASCTGMNEFYLYEFSNPILFRHAKRRSLDFEKATLSENEELPPVVKGVVGLQNLGNTCFLNSVLQCVAHTVPLLQDMILDTHSTDSKCSNDKFCVLCALRGVVEHSLTSNDRIVEPWDLVNNLRYFSSGFQRYRQEDAHEFFQSFLDRLESCHERTLKDHTSSENNNMVKHVFGGRLVSKLKCCQCGHSSNSYEPSVDLSLEIKDADNLVTALQSFTKVEKIEDQDNMFTCEGCKEQVPIEKQLTFDQVPSVAAFHLKRFENDGCFFQKIDKHVAFPLELDLLPFTGSEQIDNAELKYMLYGIVVHSGTTSTSGHYYCFIRLSLDTWCKCDDETVVEVHQDFVLSQEAYILFYAKEGTPWFSTFTEAPQPFCSPSNEKEASPNSVLNNTVNSAFSSPQITANSNAIEGNDVTKSKCGGIVDNEKIKTPPFVIVSPDFLSRESHKEVSPLSVEKVKPSQEVGAQEDNWNITPQSPPRLSSPQIYYREEPRDTVFSLPSNRQVKSENRLSCKRKLNNDFENLETKQAYSLVKKTIPGSRGQQLMAALRGSKSENAVIKKKSRIENKGPYIEPSLRTVTAGGLLR